MKWFVTFALLLCLTGCGDDDSSDNKSDETLADSMWRIFFEEINCVMFLTFAEKEYASEFNCSTGPTSMQSEIETGEYTENGQILSMTTLKSTCTQPKKNHSFEYSLSGDTFSIKSGADITVYKRHRETGGDGGEGVSITLGCFNDDGSFSPQDLSPVP